MTNNLMTKSKKCCLLLWWLISIKNLIPEESKMPVVRKCIYIYIYIYIYYIYIIYIHLIFNTLMYYKQ